MVRPADTPAPQSSAQSLPAVRVRLLGGFGVTIGGVPVPEAAWQLQKARSLVKLLALNASGRYLRQLHHQKIPLGRRFFARIIPHNPVASI